MDSKDPNTTTNGTLSQSPESDDELETPNGSEEEEDSAINLLHQEIQSLRKDRSELQSKMEATLSEMEQSEISTKALAAHVSYLEGELMKAQEDATNASSVALDAENEAKRLRSEVDGLKERITDLELERGRKDGEIRVLKEELRVSEEKKVDLEKEINKIKEMMEGEMKSRVSKEDELENTVNIMNDKNLVLEKELLSFKSKREEDLKKHAELEVLEKELLSFKSKREEDLKKNAELEVLLKEKEEINEKSREMSVLSDASGAKVNWGLVAATAASSGAVAVAVTTLVLRQKQRC